jgi:hypothetical protein
MIYINGMYRSGSTVLYNIAKQLCQEQEVTNNIQKIHEAWLKKNVKQHTLHIYSYRDIRAVTASLMRKRGWEEHNFPHEALRGNRDAKAFMRFLVATDVATRNKMRDAGLKHCILRYEEDVKDLRRGILKIAKFLELSQSPDFIDMIYDAHNIKRVNDYITKNVKEPGEDPGTMYHPNHVSLERTDWRDWISEDSWQDSIILDWLVLNGYPT